MPWYEVLAQLVRDIAVAWAAFSAVRGLDAWRQEFRGKREIEIAEETLMCFFQAREAIRAIRNPLGHSEEGTSRKPDPTERPEETRALNRAYTFYERYEKRQDVFARLSTARFRFMTLFGEEAAQPFNEIDKVLKEVLIAAQMLGGYWVERGRPYPEPQAAQIQDVVLKFEKIVYGIPDDALWKRVDDAVLAMEETCREIIEAKGTISGFLNKRIALKRRKLQKPN